jgi:hypothetical protein
MGWVTEIWEGAKGVAKAPVNFVAAVIAGDMAGAQQPACTKGYLLDPYTGQDVCIDDLVLDPETGELITPEEAERRARARAGTRTHPAGPRLVWDGPAAEWVIPKERMLRRIARRRLDPGCTVVVKDDKTAEWVCERELSRRLGARVSLRGRVGTLPLPRLEQIAQDSPAANRARLRVGPRGVIQLGGRSAAQVLTSGRVCGGSCIREGRTGQLWRTTNT